MLFGCSVSSTIQSADISESAFKGAAYEGEEYVVGDGNLQAKDSRLSIEKVFLKGKYLNLVGGFQIPNRPGASKNIKFGYGQIDHIKGTNKWVTSHPDSYVMELFEPEALGTGAPSTWPTMTVGRTQPVALDGKWYKAEAVFFLDADNVLTSARHHYNHPFQSNWISAVNLDTGVETHYDIITPENKEWTNFAMLESLGSGFIRLNKSWSSTNLDGREFLLGRGGYDALGSPLGPAIGAWNVGDSTATTLMTFIKDVNPQKRDPYYTFPSIYPNNKHGSRLGRFKDPVDGVGSWLSGDVGGIAIINHPLVKGVVATTINPRGVLDYRSQGDGGSGGYFAVYNPKLFYSPESGGSNRGNHWNEPLNQAYGAPTYGRTGIVYDPDDIAASFKGEITNLDIVSQDTFEWPRAGFEWSDEGLSPTVLGDLFWDDDRQYLWVTQFSRNEASYDMVLAAYEIIVDDTRPEQPLSIPDGWPLKIVPATQSQ